MIKLKTQVLLRQDSWNIELVWISDKSIVKGLHANISGNIIANRSKNVPLNKQKKGQNGLWREGKRNNWIPDKLIYYDVKKQTISFIYNVKNKIRNKLNEQN